MRQLTSQEREALMADMRSFFDHTDADEELSDESVDNERLDIGHSWSGIWRSDQLPR